MQRWFRQTCLVWERPGLKNISTHLLQVHDVSSVERKAYLKQSKVSLCQASCQPPSAITEKLRCNPHIRHPQRDQEQQRERQRLRPPNPILNSTSAINSLFWSGSTQCGKTYFVQQILKHNLILYEEQKSIRIFWYYNQWQNVVKSWKSLSEKASGLKEVCPSCLKICVKSILCTTTSSS